MLRKMAVLIGILTLMGGVMAMPFGAGGGDPEHGFYWWNDDTTMTSPYDGKPGCFWAWLQYPERLPKLQYHSHSYSGTTIRHGPVTHSPGYPYRFISWYELNGKPDDPAADDYYVGHILNKDGYTKEDVPLTEGGKIPPEWTGDGHFHELEGTYYFCYFDRIYNRIDISTDGWAAFNSDGEVNPQGKIPSGDAPNATMAPFWVDLVSEQQGYDPSTGGIHPDSGGVLWGFRWYVMRLNGYSERVPGGIPTVDVQYLRIPVFVIEWCDMQLSSNPSAHYKFQLQLINLSTDSAWARFVTRLARPGLKDSTSEPDIAWMWRYQGRVLFPQFVVFLYDSRYDEASHTRKTDNTEPPPKWPSLYSEGYNLVGVENEDGTKGLESNYNHLADGYAVKFDYFKRYYNDIGISIANPPFNIVLRWTELQPVVTVKNYGRNPADNVPVSIEITKEGTVVYSDNTQIPHLNGLGTDRWKSPVNVAGSAGEFQFAKIWIPEDIGTKYHIKAFVSWGSDQDPANNVDEKDVFVHCDDTLKYHDRNPVGPMTIGPYIYVNQFTATYVPYGGSPIGFSWVKGLACYLFNFDDGYWNDFEMALVEDNKPGPGVGGTPNQFRYNYDPGWGWWTNTLYPSLALDKPLSGRSENHDGWYNARDTMPGMSGIGGGLPGWTVMTRHFGNKWFNDTLYLGDSLAPGAWTRSLEGLSKPHDANTYENIPNEEDAWIVFFEGRKWGPSGYISPHGMYYAEILMADNTGRMVDPFWELVGTANYDFNMDPYYGPVGPQRGDRSDFPMYPCAYMFSPYPDSIPWHPITEAFIHTGEHDVALYEVKRPKMYDAPTAVEPGYYVMAHDTMNFEAKICNLGRMDESDDANHRLRIMATVLKGDSVVFSSEAGIPSLPVGEAIEDAKPPRWDDTGPGNEEYDLVLCVNLDWPGLHGADHCPYNDSASLHFAVLWRLDIACTEIVEPTQDKVSPGETINLKATFKNVGMTDTTHIPVTCKIWPSGDEIPKDSLVYQSNYWIEDLNWRASPAGPPIEETVDFGSFKVPQSTVRPGEGMCLRIEFRVAEIWSDDYSMNDIQTKYINCVGIAEKPEMPKSFELSSVAPNPMGSSVHIKYSVPVKTRVSLKVYDVSGKLIRTLVNDEENPGFKEVSWNGLDRAGRKVSRGIYFVRMDAPNYTATRKIILLR